MSSCGRVKTGRAIPWFYSGLASGGVYRACPVAGTAVSSYLTFPPLPAKAGGLFLLHYPWSRLRRPLTGALPCEARTFLTCITSATVRLTHRIILTQKTAGRKGAGGKIHQILFYAFSAYKSLSGAYTWNTLPPTNSLMSELFGIGSAGAPRKYAKNFMSLFAVKYSGMDSSIL